MTSHPRLIADLIALDSQVRSTIQLTSGGRLVKPGETPPLPMLMTQMVANQVALMQALRDLIVLMVAPEEAFDPDGEPPVPRDS